MLRPRQHNREEIADAVRAIIQESTVRPSDFRELSHDAAINTLAFEALRRTQPLDVVDIGLAVVAENSKARLEAEMFRNKGNGTFHR